MGRHSRTSLWRRPKAQSGRRALTIELVDVGSLVAHELTHAAFAAGRGPQGRYVGLCGAEVVPAAMEETGRGPCEECWSRIAAQRPGTR